MKSIACFGLVIGLWLSTGALAQETQEPPLISVTGTAEVDVTPDLVDVSLGVETRDKDFSVARDRNNSAVTSVMAAIKKFGIDAKDVQTSMVAVAPSYDEIKDGRRLQYFSVKTGISVTLRNVKQTSDFLAAVLGAGANQVDSLGFRSSESRRHADQARLLALKAAKEKANAVAKEMGVSLGKPYRVVEAAGWGGSLAANSFAYLAGVSNNDTGPVEPGQVKIAATFTVSFKMQ